MDLWKGAARIDLLASGRNWADLAPFLAPSYLTLHSGGAKLRGHAFTYNQVVLLVPPSPWTCGKGSNRLAYVSRNWADLALSGALLFNFALRGGAKLRAACFHHHI